MIPTAYYAITDRETMTPTYYILGQEITKEEFYAFSSADRKIDQILEVDYLEKMAKLEEEKLERND